MIPSPRKICKAAPALLLGWLLTASAHAGGITVSAAASLSTVFKELAPLFEQGHSGKTLRLNFGGSGALVAQIAKGAPVDVFASADQDAMHEVEKIGAMQSGTRRDVAANTLVLIVPRGTRKPPERLSDLLQPGYARIAIGLPASVPAGRYTKGALETAGLWTALETRTIPTASVRQALDYVARAEVDAGFVYRTDAALMPDKVEVAFSVPTPTPIRYPVAVLKNGPNPVGAQQFVDFLFTPAAQAVLARHGFAKP